MKKSTIPLLLFLGSGVSSAFVSFEFDYTKATDFDDVSKAALQDVADNLGNIFRHTATINIEVTSSNENSDVLASAGSEYSATSSSGFGNRGVVGHKILTGSDLNGASFDGSVDMNFYHNWDFDDSVAANAYDFKSTMKHELLHAIGFSSDIQENGEDASGNYPGDVGDWVPFDQFVADSNGAIIDGNSFKLDGDRWDAASIGGAGPRGLSFIGKNAVAANGGNPVYLYSPTTWEDGSSGSHLDDDFYTSQNLLMEAAADEGPGTRTLSAIEKGMLQDLGFTIVPEPSSTSLILLGALACLRRRKR